MTNYPTYKLGELISETIGGDWGKVPDYQDDSYELAYCIRGAEYKNWASEKGSTAVLRKIKSTNLLKRQLKEGDIIVEISGGGPEQPVGRTEVITKDVLDNFKGKKVICTNFLRLVRPNIRVVDSVFLNHYLKFFYSTGEIIKYQAGSNNLRNLKFNDYLSIPIPLPPLPTQRAIVTRIETLFAELDKAAVHLRTAQQQLKTYRQAVLNHWLNNEEGKWEMVKLGNIADVNTGSTPKRGNKDYWENGNIPWITSGETNNPYITKATEFITTKAIAETNCKIIAKGSLVIAMYGEGKTRGKCAELSIDATTNQALASITFTDSRMYKNFAKWFFEKNYEDMRMLSSGGVQPNLNLGIIKNMILPLPPLAEQQRIVNEIESRLSQATASETYIENALQQAEALRQSILKKAFSGELV